MVEDVKTEDKVAWNLASGIIQEINGLLSTASQHYVKRDYARTFDYLKAVKMRISSNLEPEELEELAKMEEDLYMIRGEATNKIGFKTEPKARIAAFRLWKLLDNYNHKLMFLLKRYGYLIPPQQDRTKMNA